jgi:proliferating cell nuclear antigen
MKLTLSDPTILKDSISIISDLVNEGSIKVDAQGLEMIAMDPANVAMIVFKLLSSAFVEYDVSESIKIGINMNNLRQILRRVKSDDMLILEISEENRLNITFKGNSVRKFSLPIIDIDDSEQKVPELNFPATLKAHSSVFTSAIEDVDIVADSVLLEMDKEKIVLNAKGDMSRATVEVKAGDDTQIIIEDDNLKYKAKYSIEYLKKMITGSKLSDQVTVQFSNDYPLRLEYKVVDKLMLSFILAPRVENE